MKDHHQHPHPPAPNPAGHKRGPAYGRRKDDRKLSARGQFDARVISIETFGGDRHRIMLELANHAAECFRNARAGQFVQIACRDLDQPRAPTPLLRRPFSLAGVCPDPASGKVLVEIIFRALGVGTQWLVHRRPDEIIDLLGPLGNGFTTPPAQQRLHAQGSKQDAPRVLLVGGGVGLPPLYFFATQLHQAGFTQVVAIAGAHTRGEFCGRLELANYRPENALQPQLVLDQYNRCQTPVILTTDDGSVGFAGSTVDACEQFLDDNPQWRNAKIYACGPDGMLKALAALARGLQMPCEVSMEAYMTCGFGVCQSCVIEVVGLDTDAPADQPQYRLVCSDGPVFDAQTIKWE